MYVCPSTSAKRKGSPIGTGISCRSAAERSVSPYSKSPRMRASVSGAGLAEAQAPVSQTTSIGRSRPGSGKASASRLDRVARSRERRRPGLDPHGVLRPPPGSADLAVDEERARPDARRPEPLPLILARDEQRRAPLRRAGSRRRRSAAGARARRATRRRASRPRPLRAATRRRAAIEPAAAIPRATRTSRRPTASRSRPSGRSCRPSSARTRGGSVERARAARRPERSSESGTVQTVGARAPSQRIASVPVGAAYLIALPMPSAPRDLAVGQPPAVEIGVHPLGHRARPDRGPCRSREAARARTARSRASGRRRSCSEGPRAGRARDAPTSRARPRRPARAARAARPAACCPAGRPTPPAAATPRSAAGARRASRPAGGTPGSAAA